MKRLRNKAIEKAQVEKGSERKSKNLFVAGGDAVCGSASAAGQSREGKKRAFFSLYKL